MSLSPKEKIKTLLKLLFEPRVFYSLISFRSFGYLLETGWLNSFKSHNPVDAEFKPLPWFTYSAIDFLKEKLEIDFNLLEFGSGNSTQFFSERIQKIISIEHNKEWFDKISKSVPANAKLLFVDSKNPEEYINSLKELNQTFDIIIVDGIYRNECLKEVGNYLSANGVIVLDDSERADYHEGISFLVNNGFRRLNFSGIAPGIFFKKCTTLFYKSNNILGI